MTARLVRWYDNGRGPRVVIEIDASSLVVEADYKAACDLRDDLIAAIEDIKTVRSARATPAQSHSHWAFAGCCNKWQVGQDGPCILEPNHDGDCLGRTGTTMGG